MLDLESFNDLPVFQSRAWGSNQDWNDNPKKIVIDVTFDKANAFKETFPDKFEPVH